MRVGKVVQLDRYRERRSVRRAAAYVVVGASVLCVIDYLRRSREVIEHGIRLAAQLLPDDERNDDEAHRSTGHQAARESGRPDA